MAGWRPLSVAASLQPAKPQSIGPKKPEPQALDHDKPNQASREHL